MNFTRTKLFKTLFISTIVSASVLISASAADIQGAFVTANSTVNLRSAPTTESSVQGSLPDGSRVLVNDIQGGWANVSVNGNTGFISTAYLYMMDVMDVNAGGAKVTTPLLYVRNGPSVDYPVVGNLSEGFVATIVGVNDGWIKVSYGDYTGFVHPEYIEIVPVKQQEAASNVIDYAKQFIGTRYVYGGRSPSGFDCSGFTGYVYDKFGVSLPRTSSSQYSATTRVSRDNLQPGDLVFFSNGGRGVGHVGIYVGNNSFIHSPSAGKTVCIDSMSGYYEKNYIGGGRI